MSQVINSGGIYHAEDDSWTVTSTDNAPLARYRAKAVWTGADMIVWGGLDNSILHNTGGRFNPALNSWAPTSTVNAPLARQNHTAIWTGEMMIIWGGVNENYLDTGGRYWP